MQKLFDPGKPVRFIEEKMRDGLISLTKGARDSNLAGAYRGDRRRTTNAYTARVETLTGPYHFVICGDDGTFCNNPDYNLENIPALVGFDPNKPFRTRDGREVRDFQLINDGAFQYQCKPDGKTRFYLSNGSHAYGMTHLDLVNLTEPLPVDQQPAKPAMDAAAAALFPEIRDAILSGLKEALTEGRALCPLTKAK